MKKSSIALAALGILLLVLPACSGQRQSTRKDALAASQEDGKSRKRPDQDEIVCKIERVTGSHIRRKVCKSRFMWEMENISAQDFLRRPRAGYQLR
ncbi:MAG: hypothetical protein DRI34_05780 [Deltaproteobacteria bacterium]|nr:MAG: hypothetical protein DRI34_05780 [Deltaproteobacteria bacterium]